MMKRKLLSVLIGQAFGAAVATAVALPALAQEAPAAEAQPAGAEASAPAPSQGVQRVTVTGSSIKRIASEGALPVQILTRQDIERSGVTTTADLVQQLPSLQGFTASSDSVGGGGGGFMGASLHDIGEEYTLVLLNGKRMAPRGSGSAVDLNSIPLSAIERVEVLTDGASAIYGSDAIAGVINFILKKNMQGVETAARYTSPQHQGGKGWNASITGGFGDFDADGVNFLLSYSHDRQDQLKATDRDFAKSGMISFSEGGRNLYFFNGSPNAIPANARVRYRDSGGVVQTYTFNPYLMKTGACASANSQVGDECYFDYTSTIEIQPESDRDSLFGRATFKLGSDWTGSVDAAFSRYKMTTRIAPLPSGYVNVPTASAIVTDWVRPYLTPEQNADITSVQGRWRALPAGNRTVEWTTESTHLVAGIEGAAIGWDLSGAMIYSVNNTKQDYLAGWLLTAPFLSAVNSGSINIFAPSSELTSADQAALASASYSGPWTKEKTTMTGVEARGSRPIFKLAGGDAQIGTGVDVRQYKYSYTVAEANANEQILGLGKDDPYALQRGVYGVFGELALPVIKNLEITGALRYDTIGKVRDNSTGMDINSSASDTTYKLSGRYQPVADVLVRSSVGTGFKAPTMLEIGRPRSEFGVTGDNYECPFPAGDPMAAYCVTGTSQYTIYKQGYAKLKPERSEQKTLGIVLQPTSDLSLAADYWEVVIKDQVTELSEAQIFGDPTKYRDLFTTKRNSATGEDELAIIQAAVNIGKAKYSGIDWNTNWKLKTPIGRLTTNLSGTYMLTSKYTRPGTSDDWTDSLGKYGENNAVTFRNIIKLAVNFAYSDWSHTLTMKYRSGYRDQMKTADECSVTVGDASGDCTDIVLKVPAYELFDWQTAYVVGKTATVTFGINNLFDKKPPLSLQTGSGSHQIGYDPRYTDSYGRTFYLAAGMKF